MDSFRPNGILYTHMHLHLFTQSTNFTCLETIIPYLSLGMKVPYHVEPT